MIDTKSSQLAETDGTKIVTLPKLMDCNLEHGGRLLATSPPSWGSSPNRFPTGDPRIGSRLPALDGSSRSRVSGNLLRRLCQCGFAGCGGALAPAAAGLVVAAAIVALFDRVCLFNQLIGDARWNLPSSAESGTVMLKTRSSGNVESKGGHHVRPL
jgi:hypothetical protein